MKIIDISVAIDDQIIIWPGNRPPLVRSVSDMKKGKAHNETSLEMNVHTGTHLDAPRHFIANGKSIDQMDPSIFMGDVFVADFKNGTEITSKDLENICLPKNTKRLLFKTSNSKLWGMEDSSFIKNYVGITPDAATWIVKKKIKLVGIDYLSVARFEDAVEVHNILLKAEVAILEGVDLSNVKEGEYELLCLPIKIKNAEGSPARAVLIKK